MATRGWRGSSSRASTGHFDRPGAPVEWGGVQSPPAPAPEWHGAPRPDAPLELVLTSALIHSQTELQEALLQLCDERAAAAEAAAAASAAAKSAARASDRRSRSEQYVQTTDAPPTAPDGGGGGGGTNAAVAPLPPAAHTLLACLDAVLGDAEPLLHGRPATAAGLDDLLGQSPLLRELAAGAAAPPAPGAPPSALLRRDGAVVSYARLADMYREAAHSAAQLRELLAAAAGRLRDMQAELRRAKG